MSSPARTNAPARPRGGTGAGTIGGRGMSGIHTGHQFSDAELLGGSFGDQFGIKYGAVFATFDQWHVFGYKNGTINAALPLR